MFPVTQSPTLPFKNPAISLLEAQNFEYELIWDHWRKMGSPTSLSVTWFLARQYFPNSLANSFLFLTPSCFFSFLLSSTESSPQQFLGTTGLIDKQLRQRTKTTPKQQRLWAEQGLTM
jgi:hypothetical protein